MPADTAISLYHGDDLFMELTGSGGIRREYTFFPGVDQPHSVRQGGSMYYYMTEGPGTVTGLVNSSNQVVNRYRYDPFGKATLTVEAVSNPLRFTGREYDAESGLYFYRARYYDPEVRRFISEDPIGLEGGINPYAYVDNDPINNRDPSGLLTITLSWTYYRDLRNKMDGQYPDFNQLGAGPRKAGGGNKRKRDTCESNFSPEDCALLRQAIASLVTHEDKLCRGLGNDAVKLLGGSGFLYLAEWRIDNETVAAGRARRRDQLAQTPNRAYIMRVAFRPGLLMNTIAHEMWHLRGYEDFPALRPRMFGGGYDRIGAEKVGSLCKGVLWGCDLCSLWVVLPR